MRFSPDLRAKPEVAAAQAANPATKQTACCSFFRFDLTITDGKVAMVVTTDSPHETVLAALAARAEAKGGASAADRARRRDLPSVGPWDSTHNPETSWGLAYAVE